MQRAISIAWSPIYRFLTWWFGELAALVPPRIRRAFAGSRDTLCFAFSDGQVVVSRAVDGGLAQLARVNLDGPDSGAIHRTEIQNILNTHAKRDSAIVITVPADQALCKTLDLPLAAAQGLRDLLYFELDRQTPYRAEDVRYDFRILDRDSAARRIKVELVVVPREAIDRVAGIAAEWGLKPMAVTVAGIDDPAEPQLDLARDADEPEPPLAGRLVGSMFGVAVVVLLAAAVYLPMESQRKAAEEAGRAVSAAMAGANEVAALREELDRMTKAARFLIERKRETPMVTMVLADLTRLFPEDTWLFELHVKGSKVRARGYSPAASAVLELLERGSRFRNARFTSPVTRVPGIDRERFDLSFEIAPEEAQ